AVRACRVGRSCFYIIAACAAGSLLVFQTCLNVFGSVDLLPLTGVTFPFVSNGGSAMMSAWGLLAFLKATDTRENASFAIRRAPQRRLTEEARRRAEPVEDPFGTERRTADEED
ncbi:MAG: FtsW/RodA/SpoVE family cell cycle protein, partial [Oscillospiraceae bacterium]|nr:FtsW/RodA/SpoVE family cell cycle protein [Oscillospiraceae bacterium]